ncbi:NAC domain-containing protein 2-like [Ziziphus jujuba]|uniref:NAC domain-containing protein 2-like n=1 Tax=Ziziphus jujuba TaxID=326968 RepID=A0A6P4B4V1_ZIZJJ|nr:NAC domain-containing protein 2-like [Ziziphus jujuba]
MEFPAKVRVPQRLKGWRFRPTDEELVGYYLLNKITGSTPLPNPSIVHDFDVFGKQEPWEIWNMFRPHDDHDHDTDPDDLYFFTKPKKTTPKGKRFNRKVGSGTWKGQNSGTEICGYSESGEANNVVMGLKKRFHYENKQLKDQDGSWIMFEYCLAGSLEHCITGPDNDFVLCQIRKKSSSDNDNKKNKNKRKNVIMSLNDDDYVLPPLKNQKTNHGGNHDSGMFAIPPSQALPICQREPPFPKLPQDLPLAVEGDHGHNTDVQVYPLPLPLTCPQLQQQQQQQQPPLPQSSLPLPELGDEFVMLLPQQPLPLPQDDDFDDFILDFGVLDDFNL